MKRRMSAIVPARNEEPRIARVLQTLTTYPNFCEVVVVDDGSQDATAHIAEGYDARVVRNEKNLGKGAAMQRGTETAQGDIFFFCDADIIGLTHQMIDDIVEPVFSGAYEMYIAARKEKERRLASLSYSPLLDGQRALTRELWERVPAEYKRGFSIESALNHYARSVGYKLFDITQEKKEEKRGYFTGTLERLAMYWDVMFTKARLAV